MQNITMTRKGNELTIKVDLSKDLGESKSGKNIMVASTEGNQHVEGEGGFVLGLNVYKKK